MFILIVFSILGLMYGYTGWRLITPLRLTLPWSLVIWGGVITLLLLPILVIRMRSYDFPTWLHDALSWIAYVGLGFVTLTFFLLLGRDLVWLLIAGGGKLLSLAGIQGTAEATPLTLTDPIRRQFLLNTLNLGVVGISTALTGYGFYAARHRFCVFEVPVPIRGLPTELDGFRIVQISDIHVGQTIKRDFVQRAVDRVKELAPDLIALTGDMIDGEVEQLRHHVAPLAELEAPCGCFFVTGNHEYYNNNPEAWIEETRRLGFTVLLNEHRLIERDGGRILLAGVTDYGHGSDPEAALADAPPGDVRILLAHQPRSIFAAAKLDCHLQLSGHTHGGQFVPWKYFIPLQQPFVAGLHRFEKTWIYVNRGTGYWGPPLRVGAPAEISLLILKRAEETTT